MKASITNIEKLNVVRPSSGEVLRHVYDVVVVSELLGRKVIHDIHPELAQQLFIGRELEVNGVDLNEIESGVRE